jgi:AraC-like DNA-binding protein
MASGSVAHDIPASDIPGGDIPGGDIPGGDADGTGGQWHSRDPAEAQHILSSVYAPHDLAVSKGGPFTFEFRLLDTPHLTAGLSTFRTDVTIEVPPPSTFYCLCLAPRGTVGTRSGDRATTVSTTTAAVLNADEPWCFADWSNTLMSVRIRRTDLEDDLAAMTGRRVERPIVFSEPLDLRDRPGREFAQIVRNVQGALGESGRMAQRHPAIASRLGALLRSAMLVAFPHNYSDLLSGEHSENHVPQSIRRVIEAVEHDPMQVATAAAAARIAHLSLRALESGFERHIGVSPITYVRQVRMARARQDLLNGDPENDTVSAVAHRWGFGHAGRFASAYKQRYEEAPSQTLRRII